jgi:hypothetical protein
MTEGDISVCPSNQDRHSAGFIRRMMSSLRSHSTFSRRSAVKPIGRRFGTGGCMSWRMAERMAAMASSCMVSFLSSRVSSCTNQRASSLFDSSISRNCTKARMIRMLMVIARSLLSTVDSMATPCSVKA